MGGSAGKSANNVVGETTAEKVQRNGTSAGADPKTAQLLADYGSGKLSLKDAMAQAQTIGNASDQAGVHPYMGSGTYSSSDQGGIEGGAQADLQKYNDSLQSGGGGAAAIMKLLATDPASAQKYAADSLKSDSVMGKYFGDGGMQDQVMGAQGGLDKNVQDDRQALLGKGEQYGLTDSDLKAYGQASGNVARLFGSQEQGLSNSLSDRGLAAGSSGSAGAAFSGLNGNKDETLAGIQQGIAQNRINTAQSLAQFRSTSDAALAKRNQDAALQLGQLGQSGEQGIRSANLGAKSEGDANATAASQIGRAGNEDQQNELNEQFKQQQATKQKSFGEQLGDGLSSAIAGGISNTVGNALDPVGAAAKSGVTKGLGALM